MGNKAELSPEELRRQAEERMRDGKGSLDGSTAKEGKDALSLVHELQVHQIELEMQNEELRRAKLEAEDAMMKYSDLYDFAPIGLFTLDEQGVIREVNQAGAALLGLERRNLLNRRFLLFVAPEDRIYFNGCCQNCKIFDAPAKQACELRLVRDEGPPVYVRIEGIVSKDCLQSNRQCCIAVIDITERKRAEDALQESEELARRRLAEIEGIYESAPIGLCVFDEHLRWQRLNQRIAEINGIPIEAHLGKTPGEIIPDIGGQAEDALRHIMETGQRLDFEMSGTGGAQPGKLRIFQEHWIPMKDEQGQVVGISVAVEEITERKQIESDLRTAKQRLEMAQAAGRVGTFEWDVTTTRTMLISGMEAVYGAHPGELTGGYEAWRLRVHPDDIARVETAIEDALSGKAEYNTEYRIFWPDGSIHWVGARGYVNRDEKGRPLRIIGVNADITERKLAEEQIKEDLNRLAEAEEIAHLGSWEMDIATGRSFWSDEFFKICGFEPQTFDPSAEIGMGLIHPEDREMAAQAVQRAIKTGDNYDIEKRIVRPTGEVRWVHSVGKVVFEGDRPVKLAGSFMDITERKRAEDEISKARDELELRVQERTADLTKANVELIKARDLAEVAVEAKAAFMANMSHELRTPMNYILGMTSLLLEEPLTPELKEYVEIIRQGGDRMMALVNDILDFSKAEKKKVVLERQPLSLRVLVEESLEMVAPQAAKKNLNLAAAIEYGTTEAIVGDHGRLRQVLVNLLSNAIKFTDEGEISVSLSSKTLGEKKRQILFEVKDTGIGIPKDSLGKLFLPFSQVDMTISRGHEGAGLGLAICKDLVELMGGTIWAQSKTGAGSTFYFTVEAEIAPDDGMKPTMKAIEAVTEMMAEKHPLAILVAEDEPSNQRVLVEMLRRMGYRADAVADGLEVLEALELRPYDLVLMDIKMPQMDGIEAAKEIRRRWPKNGPKIVAITAYALSGDREKCLESGMDDYIAKPVQKGELVQALRRCSHKAQ